MVFFPPTLTSYGVSGAKGIDVYDRDELIKAVCLHAQRKANNGHNDNNNDDRAASASALRGMAPVATVPAVPPVPRPSSNGTAEKNTTMSRLLVRKDDTSGALTVIVDNNAEKQDNVCYGWRDMIWFHPCYRPKTGEISTVGKVFDVYTTYFTVPGVSLDCWKIPSISGYTGYRLPKTQG